MTRMSDYTKIPYEKYQNGKYVSLAAVTAPHARATPLIRADQYRDIAQRYRGLSRAAQDALTMLAQPVKSKFDANNPLSRIQPDRRNAIGAEIENAGLGRYNAATGEMGVDADTKTIVRDINRGGRGFHAPVFNVNGHPVVATHFDAAGNLSPVVAAAYGVPARRDEAIAARVPGIRADLHPRPAQSAAIKSPVA